MLRLDDLVCLITGADEGVGFGIAQGFARRGAQVAAGLRDASKNAVRYSDAGEGKSGSPKVLALQMDVTQAEEVEAAVAQVVSKFGRLDVLINNAGIYPRCRAQELNYEHWRRLMEINLDGAWRCCEAVIPHFVAQQTGGIINVGSIQVRLGLPDQAHYQASKAGIVGLTRGLARDLGKENVRVNCIHLGAIFTEGELREFPDSAEVLRIANEKQCLSGRLTPESVEPTFAFLASSESRDITGQCLTVDRGWTHD